MQNILLEHDWDAEREFRERGQNRDIRFISCHGIVKKEEIMKDMSDMMRIIQDNYKNPVDIEFTINLSESGEYVINLLQCRPLQVLKETGAVIDIADVEEDSILFECKNASMGYSRQKKIDMVVMIDPVKYYEMPYNEKYTVARALGEINRFCRAQDKMSVLFAPGRIGTSSPELGVPTSFADISGFEMLCEVSESSVGYCPELSYGSHFFQDLVESGILYAAVFEDEHTVHFHPDRLSKLENKLPLIAHKYETYNDVIGVYDVSSFDCELYNNMQDERVVCTLKR